jgi:CP family cyanate transporter-like MFS transporter
VLAVPPLIPLIHRDFHLSQSGVGVLTALPSLMFALAAVPGSVLVARLGPVRTLALGLFLTAVASALRGAHGVALLYGMTILMSAGIAVMHPALPRIVRDWMPDLVGFGTAVYSNGLLMGELLVVWLTGPFILPLLTGRWGLTLAAWAIPVFITSLLIAIRAPRSRGSAETAPRLAWRPDWNDPLLWRLGFILGGVNCIYFGINFFLPDYLYQTNRPGLVIHALTALNFCQLPASLLLLPLAGRLSRLRSSYVVCGLLLIAALLGIAFAPGQWVVAASGFLGFLTASLLILILVLPPALAAHDDVHRLSAGMFTISYSCGVAIPILSGFFWDLTQTPVSVFLLPGICALAIAAIAFGLRVGKKGPLKERT